MDSHAPLDPFVVTVVGHYPPVTHPGDRRRTITARVEIPQVRTDQTRRAMTIPQMDARGDITHYLLRSYQGGLYTGFAPNNSVAQPATADFPGVTEARFAAEEGWDDAADLEQQHAEHAERAFGEFLIIDGYVWVSIPEPRFLVQRVPEDSDLANAGGLCFRVVFGDTPSIPAEAYFRADDFTAALNRGLELARADGDSAAERWLRFEASRPNRRLVVHDADSVRLEIPRAVPAALRRAQDDYAAAAHDLAVADTAEAEREAFERVCSLRELIVEAGLPPLSENTRPIERR